MQITGHLVVPVLSDLKVFPDLVHMGQSVQVLVFVHGQITLFIEMGFILVLELDDLLLVGLVLVHEVIIMFGGLVDGCL